MHYLYLITRDDGEQYVGVTQYPFRRMKEHFAGRGSKALVNRVFIYDILAEGSEEEIYQAEIDYIKLYKPTLNKAPGGTGGSNVGQNKGSSNGKSILDENTVQSIRIAYSENVSTKNLADKFGVSRETILHIVTGRTWKHVEGPITIKKSTKKLSEDQIAKILDLRSKGRSFPDIANTLGISTYTAHKYCKERL